MATAKKPAAKAKSSPTAAKKPAAKAKVAATPKKVLVASKTVARVQKDEMFAMPQEVKDWIDNAMSRMRNMQSKIDRLEAENKELKGWRKWAEHRILSSSHE